MRINAAIATGARYPWKLALLGLLLVIDMVTQATSDYGDFGTSPGAATFSFAFSLLTQFATAATIYSILSQTFPFQIGLVGVVTSRFLLVTLLYFVLTIFASGLRVMNLRDADDADDADDPDADEQLSHPFFVTMSSLAKLLAPFYYSMTIRAAYELCFPVYYDEEAWRKILERPLLAERVRSARMAKEATRSVRSRSRGHKKTKKQLDDQEDDESSSVGSSSSSSSSSSIEIGEEK